MTSTSASRSHSSITGYWQYVLLLLALLLFSFAYVKNLTPRGSALSNDSLIYLLMARSIAEHGEVARPSFELEGPSSVPVTTWPPLYPALLSTLFLLDDRPGIERESAIARLNALLLFLTLVTMTAVLHRSTALHPLASGACSLLICALPPLHIVYTYAWSETLFIPLLTGGLYFALRSRESDDTRGADLMGAAFMALCLAAATWTRYVGVVFFAGLALAVIAANGKDWKRGLKLGAVMGLVYVTLTLPLVIRNLAYSGILSGADRGESNASLTNDALLLVENLEMAFLSLPPITSAVVVTLGLATLAYYFKGGLRSTSRWLTITTLGCSTIYLASLLVFRQMQSIDLDARMISVTLPLLVVAAVCIVHGTRRTRVPLTPRLALVAVVFALLVNGARTYGLIVHYWERSGYPGYIGGMFYNNVTSAAFTPLRRLAEHYALDGEVLVSDLRRPRILAYFFPRAEILRLRADTEPARLKELLCTRDGLLLLTSPPGPPAVERLIDMQSDAAADAWIFRETPLGSPRCQTVTGRQPE